MVVVVAVMVIEACLALRTHITRRVVHIVCLPSMWCGVRVTLDIGLCVSYLCLCVCVSTSHRRQSSRLRRHCGM